jgi:hypothetical protein
LGIPLFAHLSVLPINSWSIEIFIARNILNGYGFIALPLDPPALWRPPLAVGLLLPIEALFSDPYVIYKIFGALTLAGLLVGVFYLMKLLGGNVAAHFSQVIILVTPAVTVLVSRQFTLLSFLLMFSLVPLAVLSTLWSWLRADWRRDLLMGVCWGVVFLARPETILLFCASLFAGMAFYHSLKVAISRATLRLILQLTSFLVIYGPVVLIFNSIQKRYDLIGQEPLFTFYAGAHWASNQLTGDIDAEGYKETVERYGTPEKYHNSLFRFMIAQPRAIQVRIKQNLKSFKGLVQSLQILNFWDCTAFLAFSSILVFARPPSLPRRTLVSYMTILLIASPYFLVFHMDIRYSLQFVLVLILWIAVTSFVFWTWACSRFRFGLLAKASCILPSLGLIVLCALRLQFAISTAENAKVDLVLWRQLAGSFRIHVPDGTPVVAFFNSEGQGLTDGDFLWFSYFSRTAVPWCGRPGCWAGFPRDRIYSFKGKALEYAWVTDERVSTMPNVSRVLVQHVPAAGVGSYSLIRLHTE